MIELNNSSELINLIQNNKKCIVDFYTTWCGPCKMLAPELEKVEAKNPEWTLIRVDAERFPELFQTTGSSGVPTVLFFKDGKQVDYVVGFRPAIEIEKIIKKY